MADVFVSETQLRAAVCEAQIKFEREVRIDLHLARVLVQQLSMHLARGHHFGEAMRYALNDISVRGVVRKAYSSVAGSYFGPRGGKVSAQRRRRPTSPQPRNIPVPVQEIIEEVSGQLAWRI